MRANLGSRATTQLTEAVAVGTLTRVHNITRSVSGSPLATPWRNTGSTWASRRTVRMSGSAAAAEPVERNSRREMRRMGECSPAA